MLLTRLTYNQLKPPSSYGTSRNASSASSIAGSGFGKSIGPGRASTRNGVRSGHSRSKSQAPRPKTSHGHRSDDPVEPSSPTHGTATPQQIPQDQHQHYMSLPYVKTRSKPPTSSTVPSRFRESSLITKLKNWSLEDRDADRSQVKRTPSLFSLRSSTASASDMKNVTFRCRDNPSEQTMPPAGSSLGVGKVA